MWKKDTIPALVPKDMTKTPNVAIVHMYLTTCGIMHSNYVVHRSPTGPLQGN